LSNYVMIYRLTIFIGLDIMLYSPGLELHTHLCLCMLQQTSCLLV